MDVHAYNWVTRGDSMFERGVVGKPLIVAEPDDNRRKGVKR
ncbi:hypothetical protein L665_01597 [Ralstonia solanacearum SD54]|uniref:Uncharacterized protein n=1 Tax=Ralstonia solanacearum TaxID=305 RepID=A0A0S4UF42_RALSL|nr:hypothetical protein F504_4316 [Ralstonia pseudosolanacearum FQY_4]ESS49535.1 hypothetical protein L665_01597 [Ralstonia solanacearum SD54]CUV20817.1 conserved protein of unknown function [Ralstonia solanacearum]